jgi:uncharacterized phage protein (TIGR02220 family)
MRELNAFREWAMVNRPSTGQVALWHSLMMLNNRVYWQEWFTVPNMTLQLLTGMSRQGLEKARKGLVQKGLIEYKKGHSNQAGNYRMISLVCQKVGTEVVTTEGTDADTEVAREWAQKGRKSSTLIDIRHNTKKDRENIPFDRIIDYLNAKTGKSFRASTEATRRLIRARWNEGFREEDFRRVIDAKCKEWKGTNMEVYLRPQTLFGTKFESYLNAVGAIEAASAKVVNFEDEEIRRAVLETCERLSLPS